MRSMNLGIHGLKSMNNLNQWTWKNKLTNIKLSRSWSFDLFNYSKVILVIAYDICQVLYTLWVFLKNNFKCRTITWFSRINTKMKTDPKTYSPLRRTIFSGKNFVTRHIKFAYSYPHLYWHVYDMLALYVSV